MLYAGSYLPCGKFFTLLKGNIASAFAFAYIYVYLIINIEHFVFLFFLKKNIFLKKKLLKALSINV